MASEFYFDVVSKLNMPEVENAINQARKEVQTRFDFKGGNPIVEIREKCIFLQADNRMLLRSLLGVVQGKLAKRDVSVRFFDEGKEEPGPNGAMKQELAFKEGISKEEAKRLIALIKEKEIKVKTQIQDEQLRVTSKTKDELQKVIQLAKDNEGAVPFQFVNFH